MEKRISQRFKDLKVGDKVVVYFKYRKTSSPEERTISKIGRSLIHTDSKLDCKFQKDTGCGDFGIKLFPGNMEEFKYYNDTKIIAKEVLNILERQIYDLTRDDLSEIVKIINEKKWINLVM